MDHTAPTHPHHTANHVAPTEQRSRFVAFLLNLMFGIAGVHQIYLGNKTQGWIRFGLFFAAFPLMVLLVGFLIFPVLWVWQVVDFFLLQLSTKTDGEGKPLHISKNDAAWQKVLFIVILVLNSLYLLFLIIVVGISAAIAIQCQESGSRCETTETTYPNSQVMWQ